MSGDPLDALLARRWCLELCRLADGRLRVVAEEMPPAPPVTGSGGASHRRPREQFPGRRRLIRAVRVFLLTQTEAAPGASIAAADVWQRWQGWYSADPASRFWPVSRKAFGLALRATGLVRILKSSGIRYSGRRWRA